MKMMDANEIISFIQNSEKSTPVKVHIKGVLEGIDFGQNTKSFITGNTGVLFGEWKDIKTAIEQMAHGNIKTLYGVCGFLRSGCILYLFHSLGQKYIYYF